MRLMVSTLVKGHTLTRRCHGLAELLYERLHSNCITGRELKLGSTARPCAHRDFNVCEVSGDWCTITYAAWSSAQSTR